MWQWFTEAQKHHTQHLKQAALVLAASQNIDLNIGPFGRCEAVSTELRRNKGQISTS